MTRQILFIHSAGPKGLHEGSGDFLAFLQNSLGAEYDILHPLMPTPQSPDYEPWKTQLKKEMAGLNEGAILMGHSLGGSVILKYLSEAEFEKPLTGIFIVASPYWGADKDWQHAPFLLQEGFASKLPSAPKIFIYHSRDDEIVPVAHLKQYADNLPQASIRELEGRGHLFNVASPEILDDIKSL